MRPTKRLLVLALGLAGLLAALTMGVVLAQGGQLGGKLLTGSDVTIPAGETVDHDVYVFGGSLTSNGTIKGDIVAAGGTVNVNGAVSGDVLAAGGTVNVNGPVSGDVRTAGGQVNVTGEVAEDVAATGGQVTISGHVGQDLLVSSGQLTLTGSVAGSAAGTAGTYSKSGSIAGTDSITVTNDQGAPFVPPPTNRALDAVRQFIAVMLVALLAMWLAPRAFETAEAEVRERPLPSLGWGIVAMIGFVVFIIALTVVVFLIAIVLGLLGFGALLGIDLFGGFLAISGAILAFIVATAYVADAIVGLAIARLIASRAGRSMSAPGASAIVGRDRWSDVGWLAVGVAIVVVLTSVPYLGGWVKFVVVLLGLGSIWLTWRRSRATVPGGLPDAPASPPPSTPVPG